MDRDQMWRTRPPTPDSRKLTAIAGTICSTTDFSPNAGQIALVDSTPPAIAGFTYALPGGAAGSGYDITFTPDTGPANTGNPMALTDADITTGPFEGLKGMIAPLHAHRHRTVNDRQFRSPIAPRVADRGRSGVPVRHLRREVARVPRRSRASTSAAACIRTRACSSPRTTQHADLPRQDHRRSPRWCATD